MSIALDTQQGLSGTAGVSSETLVLASAPAQGKVLVASLRQNTAGMTNLVLTQTGVTWVKMKDRLFTSSFSPYVALWYGFVTSASASASILLTYTGSTTAVATRMTVARWTFSGTPTFDAAYTNNAQANATTLNAGSVTPPAGVECLIVVGEVCQSTTYVGASYTNSFTDLTTSSGAHAPAYRIVVSPSGAYSTAATFNANNALGGAIAVIQNVPAASNLFGRTALDGLSISGPRQFTRVTH